MNQQLIDDVYSSVIGDLIVPVQGVENVFTQGSECDILYNDVFDAYERIKERLNVKDEDDDCELIINSLMDIGRIVAYRMYEYGAKFGTPEDYPEELKPKEYYFVNSSIDPRSIFDGNEPVCIDENEITRLSEEKGYDIEAVCHLASPDELLRYGFHH